MGSPTRILYAHAAHEAYQSNSLLHAISGTLRHYGLLTEVVTNNPAAFKRIDLLAVETTVSDVLPHFMAGRAYELEIPVIQLFDYSSRSTSVSMIPGATNLGYHNAADLRRILDGYFRGFVPPKKPELRSVTRPLPDATKR